MKLYMKQKVFSIVDKFTVKDEEGNDKYKVEGKFSFFLKKFHIYDEKEKELAYIEQKFSILPKFKVFVKGEEIAEILQEFSILKPKYKISGKNWSVSGNILGREYKVQDSANGNSVANIKKEWMSWGDSYLIDISDKEDEVSVLAVVLAIDAALARK
ncbi:LURP-one-related/scramblase family protein [Fusobacterium russii]|uniref:LURP-one-related/scramblase family protein n=1 Tax=Fusobacterium russii TaxID=854 RepID=UPI0003A33F0D|nr:LURP-one-related family protein [Fusobacterium russii]